MSNTTFASGNKVTRWSLRLWKEYVREERFARYTGEEPNNVFQIVSDLQKQRGETVTIPLITKLSNSPIYDDNTLEGNEEALSNYADSVTVRQIRMAVARGEHEQSKGVIDILEGARYMLKKWMMEQLRDVKIARMLCPNLDGTTTYASTSEADKDLHLAANTDRYLFGALLSNRSTTDHSASLLNVDTTDDTLDRGIISLLKRIAESADPLLTPITVGEDEEWWVAFTGTNPHRDFTADMDNVHPSAAPRSLEKNPIYRSGDQVYQNVVVRRIPEMASIGTVGASSAPVYQVAFCGAQAVWTAWAKLTRAVRNGRDGSDYGNIRGVGICETRESKKTTWNSKQHGMVTGYVAAAADA